MDHKAIEKRLFESADKELIRYALESLSNRNELHDARRDITIIRQSYESKIKALEAEIVMIKGLLMYAECHRNER